MFSFLSRFYWPLGWSPRLTDHLSSIDITWANGLFVIWSEGKKLYVMETTLREIWLPRGCLHLPLHFLATINPREEVSMRNGRNRWELQPLAKRVNFWQHFQQLYIMILVLFFHVLSCTMHICLMPQLLKYRSKAGLLISGCPPTPLLAAPTSCCYHGGQTRLKLEDRNHLGGWAFVQNWLWPCIASIELK